MLNAFPLLFSKYLDIAVDAVWAISPWPDSLKKNIPISKKIIPLTNEKNSAAINKKMVTKIE